MSTWLGEGAESILKSLVSTADPENDSWFTVYEGADQRRSSRKMQYCGEGVRQVLAPFLSDLFQLLPRGFSGEGRGADPQDMTATFLWSEPGCEEQGKPVNDGALDCYI
jgi:hypothetical protein